MSKYKVYTDIGSLPDNLTGIVEWPWGIVCHYKDGKLHNEFGPCKTTRYGEKFYYLNSKFYSKEDWFELLTPEQKMIALFNEENW